MLLFFSLKSNKSFWSSFFQKARSVQKQRLWSLVTTSEKLELDLFNSYRQGAFAGEFFNPNIGVKKRGFCKRKAPLTDT